MDTCRNMGYWTGGVVLSDISGVVVNHRINGYSMNKSFDGYYLTRVGLG